MHWLFHGFWGEMSKKITSRYSLQSWSGTRSLHHAIAAEKWMLSPFIWCSAVRFFATTWQIIFRTLGISWWFHEPHIMESTENSYWPGAALRVPEQQGHRKIFDTNKEPSVCSSHPVHGLNTINAEVNRYYLLSFQTFYQVHHLAGGWKKSALTSSRTTMTLM